MTIMINEEEAQDFSDNLAFLVVKLNLKTSDKNNTQFALIELPKDLERFIVLPEINNKQYIMFLDDLIRYHFHIIFNFLDFKSIDSHMIKVTRDAELDMEGDVSKSYINKIIESVKERVLAEPVRLVYDKNIGSDTLNKIKKF